MKKKGNVVKIENENRKTKQNKKDKQKISIKKGEKRKLMKRNKT